jgi:acetyl esterase
MLDKQIATLLDMAKASGAPDLCELSPEVCRQVYGEIVRSSDLAAADVQIDERSIDGPGGALGLRIYTPRDAAATPRGAVLFLHGGGFVVGAPQDYDGLVSTLCRESDCVVVSVDYRLAPEHPFPAAVEDSEAAMGWLFAHAAELGADARRVVVAGDSAGGNLAAVLALLNRSSEGPALAGQILLYPVTSERPGMFESYARYESGYFLTRGSMNYFSRHYHGPDLAAADWRGAPLLSEDVSELPPALVLVGGFDPLRDEGVAYARRLSEAGNHVMLVEYAGLTHGFMVMGGVVNAARLAVGQVASTVKLMTGAVVA